jgi:hypothetical protein
MSSDKQQLYALCQQYVDQRIDRAREAMASLQVAADEETKSSAGDKYETGRAMMQLEMEKVLEQLNEAKKLKLALGGLENVGVTSTVQPGSLVRTNQGNFYIAISIGSMVLQGHSYFVISPVSPVGMKFVGLRAEQSFTFNNKTYEVKSIE